MSANLTTPGDARRRARIRPRIATSCEARRRSPLLGLRRASHEPSAASIHACELSARSAAEDRLDLGPHVRRLDRHDHLDPVVEVARHQVGAAEQVALRVAGLEAVEAAVLEEAAEDRAHADPLAEPLDARPEHADRADDQVDLGARLRGLVELLDDLRVGEVVDLDPDPRVLAGGRGGADRADALDELAAQVERRDEDLAERAAGGRSR